VTAPAPIPYPFKREQCARCGRQVIWAITVNNRPHPVDIPIDPKGTVQLTPQAGRPPIATFHVTDADRSGRELRYSHIASCVPSPFYRPPLQRRTFTRWRGRR